MRGTVLASSNWDTPPRVKKVRPGMRGSYEQLFHEVAGDFWLGFETGEPARKALLEDESQERLERAIGVIYRPETERHSHYLRRVRPTNSTR